MLQTSLVYRSDYNLRITHDRYNSQSRDYVFFSDTLIFSRFSLLYEVLKLKLLYKNKSSITAGKRPGRD